MTNAEKNAAIMKARGCVWVQEVRNNLGLWKTAEGEWIHPHDVDHFTNLNACAEACEALKLEWSLETYYIDKAGFKANAHRFEDFPQDTFDTTPAAAWAEAIWKVIA